MSQRKPILPSGLNPNPAFSPAVQVGELLFVSGQVAQDNDGKTVGVGDCEAQTRHIMSRISTIIEAAGATMPDVVKITTFLTDINNYGAFSKVRSRDLPQQPSGQLHRHRRRTGSARVSGGSRSGGAYSGVVVAIKGDTHKAAKIH